MIDTEKLYKASLDTKTKWITYIFLLVMGGLLYKSFEALQRPSYGSNNSSIYVIIIIILLVILVNSWIKKVQFYQLTEDLLIIKTFHEQIKIPLYEIKHIHENNQIPGGPIREIGTKGLFGYRGRYFLGQWGYVNFFATQKKNLILIETLNLGIFVISPDDMELFNRLQNYIEHE